MKIEKHQEAKEEAKVWLTTEEEVQTLLEKGEEQGQVHRLSFSLGVRGGLRTTGIVGVEPHHVYEFEPGYMLRVWEAKDEKYRETPIPEELALRIKIFSEYRDAPQDAPLIDVGKRQVRRWIESAREELSHETENGGWEYLSFQDLRRTWANNLINQGVDRTLVMEWGGWDKWRSLKDHYFDKFEEEIQRREMNKVDWLSENDYTPKREPTTREMSSIPTHDLPTEDGK